MIVKISVETKTVDEKILLLAIIGNLEAIKNGAITIEEAEKFLFSPHMVRKLKQNRCDDKIIEIVKKGCELEDILSLMPEKFFEIIEGIKQETLGCIKKYDEINESFWLED